ncbi:MAG: hypothetical protein R3E61_02550 [Pseudomonadales bacterium]
MKIRQLIAACLVMLFSSTVLANEECAATCETEYKECKTVAESPTAKQACEDDLQQCKTDCQ